MLSLMTVVLPSQQQQRGRSVVEHIVDTSEASAERRGRLTEKSLLTGSGNENVRVSPRQIATPHIGREVCECSCRAESMTKNNLPQRCPYLKGYMAEPRRQQYQHQHQVMHPVTLREWESLREGVCYWKEKYDRLYESQRRLQKVNEGLEEKLLKVAEKFESEKSDLTRDLSDLTTRLVESRLTIAQLEEENEQYRNDCNIAVRLLQCKPSNFIAHKFNSFPADFQAQVKRHIHQKKNRRSLPSTSSLGNSSSGSSSSLMDQCPPDVRTIKVSVPTLPPAAMVYSVNNQKPNGSNCITQQGSSNTNANIASSSSNESTPDHVSAVIIAKVLEERSKERQTQASINKKSQQNECEMMESSTQTIFLYPKIQLVEDNALICIECGSNLIGDRRYHSPSNSSTESGRFGASRLYNSIPNSTSTETAI